MGTLGHSRGSIDARYCVNTLPILLWHEPGLNLSNCKTSLFVLNCGRQVKIRTSSTQKGKSMADSEIKEPNGHTVYKFTGSEIKEPNGTTIFKITNNEIKSPNGSTLYKFTGDEIKEPNGTTVYKYTGSEIEAPNGSTLFKYSATELKKPNGSTLFKFTGRITVPVLFALGLI